MDDRFPCRADNAAYPHDGRADKRRYRHDRRADSQCLKTKVLISFVFTYAKCWFSYEAAHLSDLGCSSST